MANTSSRYAKPSTSVPEQVETLRKRGLDVGNITDAEALLRQIGYYRLSGYSYFYKEPPPADNFKAGTTLSQVKSLYDFDERLRSVLLEGISQIEVALRFHIGHRLGRRDTFAHFFSTELDENFGRWTAGTNFIEKSEHQRWLHDFLKAENRSQEAFAQHFRRKFGPHFPVWVATEIMLFGILNQLFKAMPENDRKLIALRLGLLTNDEDVDSATLTNWLNHLKYVRDVCAHQSRVWNRTFDKLLAKPTSKNVDELSHWNNISIRKLYGTISVIRFLLARINPSSNWHIFINSLISDFSRLSGISMQELGFPKNWEIEHIWQPYYQADFNLIKIVDAIDNTSTVNRPEAMRLLTVKENEAEQKRWIRYLYSHNSIIGHKIGPQMYYPDFQFKNGDVFQPVAETNRNLFRRFSNSKLDKSEISLHVQDWWLRASTRNGFEMAPIELVVTHPNHVILASRQWSCTTISLR